jgi:hypothetical protein
MGYRIEFAVEGPTLQARVRGRSAHLARAIGRDIAEQARHAAAKQLLIDVRGLVDRLGALGALVLPACARRRIAVVDSDDNDGYHPFSEFAARERGGEVRYFADAKTARAWLATFGE